MIGNARSPDVDVAVVGDGPAGAALAAACRAIGLDTVLVGDGQPWPATYGTWVDELSDAEVLRGLGDEVFATVSPRVVAYGRRRHVLDRRYGVLANERVRSHLLHGVEHRAARATGVQEFAWGVRLSHAGGAIDARVVVDATGAGGSLLRRLASGESRERRPVPCQTAFGVVIEQIPDDAAVEQDQTSFMDLREPPGAAPVPGRPDLATFAYVLAVPGGWLVEETVLVAAPEVDPELLPDRLARRLGADGPSIVAAARSRGAIERVRIPMGGRPPRWPQPVLPFGAAAGYVHPATGYSVAASLRAAGPVARALASRREAGPVALRDAGWRAVWSPTGRRTRALHRFGAAVLAGLDADQTRQFFDVFFDLSVDRSAAYLRRDADPIEVAGVMGAVFARAPWPVRRRLLLPRRRSPVSG